MVLLISFLSFGIYQLQPGDPVQQFVPREMAGNPAAIERIRAQLGLDKHWTIQYVNWLKKLATGDMGRSLVSGEPVSSMLKRSVPISLNMNLAAFFIGFVGAIAVGVLSATRRYSIFDQISTLFSFAGIAMPNFWLGILLMMLFSIQLKWLPATGMYSRGHEGEFLDLVKHMAMPVGVLAFGQIAATSRFVRTSLLEVLKLDYIRTARSKGLSERIVIYKHALRNSLMPVITFLGLGLAGFVGGSLVIENMFAIPGMGRITVNAVFQKDYAVIMGTNIMFSLLTVLGNMLADFMYAVVDPRVKFS